MRDIRHARSLYELAIHHANAVQAMLDTEIFTDDIFGFQAQQAVEKLLKSCLCIVGLQFPHTHDLEVLIRLLEENDCIIPACFHQLVDLNDFAVQFRYEIFEDEPMDRTEIIRTVLLCCEHVKSILQASDS